MTLNEFEALLKRTAKNVYHREAEKQNAPYVVWHEFRKAFYKADNRNLTSFWRVQVDHYSRNKNDPEADGIEAVLDGAEIPFTRNTYFEPELRMTRNLFTCEVV